MNNDSSSTTSNLTKNTKPTLADFSLKEIIQLVMANDGAFETLNDRVNHAEIQELRDAAPLFEELLKEWSDKISLSTEKAEFCIKLADMSILDSKDFRMALDFAIQKLLPPYLVSRTVVKSLGAKDPNVGVREVANRMKKLQHLRTTAIIYQTKSKQIGSINGIDRLEGTISIATLDGKSNTSLPITTAILNSYFFETTPEMMDLMNPMFRAKVKEPAEYPRLLKHYALSQVPDEIIDEIVLAIMVPQIFKDENAFNQWYKLNANQVKSPAQRSFDHARSVLELHTLLEPVLKADPKDKKSGGAVENISIDDDMAERLSGMLNRVKYIQAQDVKMLAECVSALSEADGVTQEMRTKMFAQLRGKVGFWPVIEEGDDKWINQEKLQIWGKIAVRFLPGMKDAALAMYSIEEFVKLSLELPVRCMTIFLENKANPELDTEIIEKAQNYLWNLKTLSVDQCLWIWKNMNRLRPAIVERLDMETVITALNMPDAPREWGSSKRDLTKLLKEKKEFQQLLIKNADGDFRSIADGLKKLRAPKSEIDGTLANMRRNSPEITKLLDTAAGREMFSLKAKTTTKEATPISSIASIRKMRNELNELITTLIPQNEKALAIARSYGDLRENAEFDAAKERKRYLQGRRNNLEATLSNIREADFSNVDLSAGRIIPGCHFVISGKNGQTLSYYLLGAHDGNTERNYLSYQADLGKALLNHRVGDEVELPNGDKATVLEIGPLPEDVRNEMAGK